MGAPQYEQAGADIGGTGTTNTIPRWTGPSTLGDSVISQDNGTNRLLIAGGTAAAAANGTNITIQAQTGGTGNTNGGDIILLGGTRSGSGTFGRVAVGTSKPVARVTIGSEGLNVNNPTLGNAVGVPLLISSADPTIFGLVMGCNAGDGRSWIQAMRTDASPTAYNITLNELGGNVGIGTASPAERLHVVSANSLSTIIASTNATQAAVELRYNTSTTCGYFGTGAALVTGGTGPDFALRVQSGAMLFATGATERARIDSAGNLLMAGNGTAASPIIANSTGVSGMYFPSASSVSISANGAIAATFRTTGAAPGVALGGTAGLVFDGSSTNQGLKLPATPGNADTQTLDCYAEGTWAPTLTGFGGTNPTVTASYTRVGRLVTIAVQIDATGGNQYSMTLGTTTITTPAGMTASSICAVPVVDGGVANRGIASVWTTGIIYLPTVALTTASTFFVATYRV